MACNCGSSKNGAKVYVVYYPDGTRKTFSNKTQADAVAKKVGGTVQEQ